VGEDKDADAAQAEAELRERVLRERLAEAETAAAREKELDEESVRLEKEIEADIRGNPGRILKGHHTYRITDLTEEERVIILTAPEFADFVESSTKIIQRALNDNYDYIRDYTLGAESGVDDSEGRRVKKVCAFFDERYGKNRSITDVDWSPKVRTLYAFL
jgi:dynein intermediate chain